jgi:hypothetical protein
VARGAGWRGVGVLGGILGPCATTPVTPTRLGAFWVGGLVVESQPPM